MNILLEGLKKFGADVWPNRRPEFESLAKGQTPHTLMITCSDSRIDPNLVTQTDPGEIFVVRNAGNIIPAYTAAGCGEEASIEFAIEGLSVRHVVVCGHSQCGAMKALMQPSSLSALPAMGKWLNHAEATRRRAALHEPQTLDSTVGENVLVQIDNLKTYPSVSAALRRRSIDIFGWVYYVENGSVGIYDPAQRQFIPSTQVTNVSDLGLGRFAV